MHINTGSLSKADGTGAQISWSSRVSFFLASVGFAVGLGNIWRFPYVTGENGGGAFVAVYLLCALFIGVPILIAELVIGRKGKKSPPAAMRAVALAENKSHNWQIVGYMNLFAAFIITVVYCVIAGWVINYLFKSIAYGFSSVTGDSAATEFTAMTQNFPEMLVWTIAGLAITGAIIYAGVKNGIERAVKILMPCMFVLLVILVIYNSFLDGFQQAVDYLFTPDFSKVNTNMVMAAIGQAFFSVGVAMAGMMTYGSYLPQNISIPRSVIAIVLVDTLVALLAGLAIFPAVFHNGLDPAGGPGLIFQTLPVAFSNMPMGNIVAVVFFLLLSVAAITSMVGLIEPLTKWLEEQKGYPRNKSAVVIILIIGTLSTLSILGYNHLAEIKIFDMNINGFIDFLANQILLPLGGLLIALFAGWFIKQHTLKKELDIGEGVVFNLWYFLIKYIAPIAVCLVLFLGISE